MKTVVPPIMPTTTDDRLDKFPVVLLGKMATLWNIHHLKLDRIPALDISDGHKLEWITTHVLSMFSDRERTIRRSRTPGSKDVLVGVKDTLCKLFISAVGIQGPRCRVFGLTEPSLGGIYTFIFVTDIRLDLASDTVVADACVLPLTSNIIEVISSTLAELKEGILVEIKTVGEEMRAWKRLLPALTERCREWKHKNTSFKEFLYLWNLRTLRSAAVGKAWR